MPSLVFICAVACTPPASGGPSPVEQEAPVTVDQREALLRVEGYDAQGLSDQLAMRVPDLNVRTTWSAEDRGANPQQLFVLARRAGPEQPAVIQVITAQGEGYVRVLSQDESGDRVVATVVANLLIAIESQDVAADLDELALPETASEADVSEAVAALDEVAVQKAAGPVAEPEPEPEPEREPESPTEEVVAPQAAPASELATLPGTDEGPHWSVGVAAAPGILLSAGPPTYADAFAGAGARLSLDLQSPRHAILGLSFRGTGARRAEVSLSRYAVGLHGGWVFRRGRFELPMVVEAAVEPFTLREPDGQRVGDEDEQTQSPLLRSGLRLSPGGRFEFERGGLEALSVFADVSMSGGLVVLEGDPVVLGVNEGTDGQERELHRLGGLEFFVGAGIRLWIPARSRAAATEP